MQMQIEFVDSKIKTVPIETLNPGDVFMIPELYDEVCINVGLNDEYSKHEYIVLGENPQVDCADKGLQVRPVKSRLVVEI